MVMIIVYFVIMVFFVVANWGTWVPSQGWHLQAESWIQVSHKHPTYPGVSPMIVGEGCV